MVQDALKMYLEFGPQLGVPAEQLSAAATLLHDPDTAYIVATTQELDRLWTLVRRKLGPHTAARLAVRDVLMKHLPPAGAKARRSKTSATSEKSATASAS